MNQITTKPNVLDPAIIESLVIGGDLSGLNNQQRVAYYKYRCEQVGLDPSAKPFDVLKLNGKTVLYANAGCTQQLCQKHGLSPTVTDKQIVDGIYCVTSRVTGSGRTTENMGAVPVGGLKGDMLANAMMKAVTKAHRRTILMHCGLGMLDETEVETIPGAQVERPRGNPLRQEYASMYGELQACGDEDTALGWWHSHDTQDFVKRANDWHMQKGGVDYGSLLENEYMNLLPKLKRTIRNPMNEQDAGETAPDVAAEASSVLIQPPPSSPDEPEFSAIAVQCMEQFDLVDDADGFKAAQKFAMENQAALTAEEKKALNELSRRVGARLREAA